MSDNALKKYTTDELLEELVRRRRDRKHHVDSIKHWCEDCNNFQFWVDEIDRLPENYNPCRLKKEMKFIFPGADEDPHGPSGFYRSVCADRTPRMEEPRPLCGKPTGV